MIDSIAVSCVRAVVFRDRPWDCRVSTRLDRLVGGWEGFPCLPGVTTGTIHRAPSNIGAFGFIQVLLGEGCCAILKPSVGDPVQGLSIQIDHKTRCALRFNRMLPGGPPP